MGFKLKHITKGIAHVSSGGNTHVLGIKIGKDLAPAVAPLMVAAAVATVNPGLAQAAVAIGTNAVVQHSLGASDKDVLAGVVIGAAGVYHSVAGAAATIATGGDPVQATIGAVATLSGQPTTVGHAVGAATGAAIHGENILRATLQSVGTDLATDAIQDAFAPRGEALLPANEVASEQIEQVEVVASETVEVAPETVEKKLEVEDVVEMVNGPRIANIPTTLSVTVPLNDHAGMAVKHGETTAVGVVFKSDDGTSRGVYVCESMYPNGACVRYETKVTDHNPADVMGFASHKTVHASNGCFTAQSDHSVKNDSGRLVATQGHELHVSEACMAAPVVAGLATAAIVVGPEVAAIASASTLTYAVAQ